MTRIRIRIGLAAISLCCLAPAHAADYVTLSGGELYKRFCASCHGATGAGDGPVAPAFKVEVPDLRTIARRRGGPFPREQIERIIDGRFLILAHGTRAMPVWGEEFMRAEIGNPQAERATEIVIGKIVDHLESLQIERQ